MIILMLGQIHLIGGTGSVGEGLIKVVPFCPCHPLHLSSMSFLSLLCLLTSDKCHPLQGNVYIDQFPVCDDGWGREEAKVACRYEIQQIGSYPYR